MLLDVCSPLSLLAAIEYIIYLQNQQAKQQEQLESLQREVKALQIMKEYVTLRQSVLVGVNGCEVDKHCTMWYVAVYV